MASAYVSPGERIPKAAFYPFLVATSTEAAREHAIERWHLPHWMEDIAVEIDDRGGSVATRADADGKPFLRDDDHRPLVEPGEPPLPVLHGRRRHTLRDPDHDGGLAERARGGSRIHRPPRSPLQRSPRLSQVEPAPFREIWMKDGVQSFTPLQVLPL